MRRSFLFAFCLLLILTACTLQHLCLRSRPQYLLLIPQLPHQPLRPVPLSEPLPPKLVPLTVIGIPTTVRKAVGEARARMVPPGWG